MTPLARDRYPSRQTSEVTLIERVDPVVYGTTEDGPLSADQLDAYEDKGYLLLEDVFGADEVTAMLDELATLAADDDLGDDRAEFHGDDVLLVHGVHLVSDLLRRVTADPRIADAARQILDSDVYLHKSRLSRKPGFSGPETYWHADFESWHVLDGMPIPRAVSASITLTDSGTQNSPLLIMPGSHHTFVTTVGEAPPEDPTTLRTPKVGVPDEKSLSILTDRHGIDTVTAPAGSVILFDANVMHGANSNITPFPRSNVFAVYNSVDNALQSPFGGSEPRPVHLASRDATPLPRH